MSTMNLTARQSNRMEFGPVDLRPKTSTGFTAVPIIPGVNFFPAMNTKLVQGKAPQFSNRQQKRDFLALGLAGQDAIPKEFDWRRPEQVRQLSKYKNLSDAQIRGFINPVFNQGQCGSCWAVSSTMMLSDRHAIASRKPYVKMNIKTVLACAESAGQGGCGGGYMQNAGHYFESQGTFAECMPYDQNMTVGPSCQQAQCPPGTEKFYAQRGSVREFRGDIDQIQSDIMNNGPVVAGYQVDRSFMSYKGGVFVQPQNMDVQGGHAVVIVGWGFDQGLGRGYWIVRNSWGPQWGENGYFRFAWNPTNNKNDGRYLENMSVSWQAKVANVKEEEDNNEPKPVAPPEPKPEPPNPNPPSPDNPPNPNPPEPQPPSPPEPKPKPVIARGLTTGGIVAISVGSTALLIVIIVLAVLLGRKRQSGFPNM